MPRPCGVCGTPSQREIPVMRGYSVPRCLDHVSAWPYEAEKVLAVLERKLPRGAEISQ